MHCARLSRVRRWGVTFFPRISAHRVDRHTAAANLFATNSPATDDAHPDAVGTGFPTRRRLVEQVVVNAGWLLTN